MASIILRQNFKSNGRNILLLVFDNFSQNNITVLNSLSHIQKRFAGHSKWSNIKFKKMHIDNARAKVFGKLSMEIIQAVKDNGPDVKFNSKLAQLVSKAKASCMPKEKIETSIKNALRETDEKYISFMLQARGPGKCGLIIDLFTPNPLRSKAEIKSILKKNDCTFIEDGSVAFMFERKGVVSVQENSLQDLSSKDKAEELAILIGAESVEFNNINNVNVVQFICDPLEFISVERAIIELHPNISILSADVQYLAKSLIDLTEEHVKRSDLVIEALSEHPDVLTIYDNIIGYPSTTIKRDVIF
uniref:Translational activator of cytochrome c oxidase 1 n=1 Tax=Hydra vulgaris TaxID=6087 RepID=T2M6X9_HYDVU